MNDQEAFEYAVTKVVQQGMKSAFMDPLLNGKGRCLYRSPGGLKCHVGWLIPDDKYEFRIESKVVQSGEIIGVLPKTLNLDILYECQKAHDHAYTHNFIANYVEKIRSIGQEYELSLTFLDKLFPPTEPSLTVFQDILESLPPVEAKPEAKKDKVLA